MITIYSNAKQAREAVKPFQTYKNPKRGLIARIVLSSGKSNFVVRSSEAFFQQRDQRDVEYLRQKLIGNVLIGMEFGEFSNNTFCFLEGKFGASHYIGLAIDDLTEGGFNINFTYALRIREDMLLFLSKFPTEKANILINGISFRDQYLELMIKEITRTVESGGIVFGYGSEPVMEALSTNQSFVEKPDIFVGEVENHFMFEKRA